VEHVAMPCCERIIQIATLQVDCIELKWKIKAPKDYGKNPIGIFLNEFKILTNCLIK
jgi:hypothetical protein